MNNSHTAGHSLSNAANQSAALAGDQGAVPAGHIRSLDGLRGLAALGVVMSHVFQSNFDDHGRLVWMMGRFIEFGARGVDLFFVLSGFLITGILFDSLQEKRYFRNFYARRSLRIFPLYYGVLLVLFVLTPLLRIDWQNMNWSLMLYLQNTRAVMPIWEFSLPHGLTLSHFWSLAVEEQFYLVWPLAVFLIRGRRRLLVACGVCAGASMLLRLSFAMQHLGIHVVTKSTLTRVDSLLCGAALALLIRGPQRRAVMRWGRTVFFAASLVLVGISVWGSQIVRTSIGLTVWAVASAGLIAWCLVGESKAARLFENGTLRWFGRYSYGIYVLHGVAAGFFLNLFRGWIGHFTSSRIITVAASGVLLAGLACAAAYLSYNLYERQFLKLKKYFDYARPESIPTYDRPRAWRRGRVAGRARAAAARFTAG